jgi:hypothetical protein
MGQAARAQLQLELQHLDEPLVAVALRRIEACTNQKTEMEANASIYDDGDRADGVCSDGDYGISREPDAQSSDRFTSSQEVDGVANGTPLAGERRRVEGDVR